MPRNSGQFGAMPLQKNNWVTAALWVPLITLWVYVVRITFQAGYLSFYHINSTFAEVLPTYLIIGWSPIIGYGLGVFISFFLICELVSRLVLWKKRYKELAIVIATYLYLLLIILVPYQLRSLPDNLAYLEFGILLIIFTVHFFQDRSNKRKTIKGSLAFYLAVNFGLLVVFLTIAMTSTIFAYREGTAAARNAHGYSFFGENPEYAVIYITNKYILALPFNKEERTLENRLKIFNLDNFNQQLVYMETGKLKVAPILDAYSETP